MEQRIKELYEMVEEYSKNRGMEFLAKALSLISETLGGKFKNPAAKNRYQKELLRVLEVCELLIDLNINITKKEEEDLLCAELLHIFPPNINAHDWEEQLVSKWNFGDGVCSIIDIICAERGLSSDEQKIYYERVQKNKLALLALLAERGNVVEKLHKYTTWDAHRYIEETKAFYYPMSIYAKENYHEILGTISVLIEKIRTLLEVSEILIRRYEVREAELVRDILALKEENATIRGIIAKFKAEMEQ